MAFLSPEVKEVALSLMESLDSPRSLTVAILIRYEAYADLMLLGCDPLLFADPESYLRAAAATDFLRKLEGKVDGIDPERAALEKWLHAERICKQTNRRIECVMDGGVLSDYPPTYTECLLQILEQVRQQMWWLLGAGIDTFEGAFGPGATLSDTSRACTILHKMSSTPTVTPSALFYLVPWTGTGWARACAYRGEDLRTVRSNVYFTVPKTALTHRACAKEPSLNGFFQLGLGRAMRARLKKRGLDLENGQDVHRRVACLSSVTEEFCTIDLSSASDTVCKALVKAITPPGWYSHLDDLRSPITTIGGKDHVLEKFSSMGNGFTFELETAIFAAIILSCDPTQIPGKDFWVYGDDLIVRPELYTTVKNRLTILGFTENSKKSFKNGPFRESCGGDFFNGSSVRAHFLKEEPVFPEQWISLANGLRRVWSQLRSLGSAVTLAKPWFKCLDQLPTDIRQCRGPEILGDLVIHDKESHWSIRWRSQIRYIRVWRPARYKTVALGRFDPEILMSGILYGLSVYPPHRAGMSSRFYKDRGVVPRDGVSGYKLGWSAYS